MLADVVFLEELNETKDATKGSASVPLALWNAVRIVVEVWDC
jgi:hypothetical protein